MIQLEGLPFYIINIVNVGGTKRWESVVEQDEIHVVDCNQAVEPPGTFEDRFEANVTS